MRALPVTAAGAASKSALAGLRPRPTLGLACRHVAIVCCSHCKTGGSQGIPPTRGGRWAAGPAGSPAVTVGATTRAGLSNAIDRGRLGVLSLIAQRGVPGSSLSGPCNGV